MVLSIRRKELWEKTRGWSANEQLSIILSTEIYAMSKYNYKNIWRAIVSILLLLAIIGPCGSTGFMYLRNTHVTFRLSAWKETFVECPCPEFGSMLLLVPG